MSESNDRFNLLRFLEAQSGSLPAGSSYQQALAELKNGRKISHWMWYIFPQIVGLGSTNYALTYAIESLDEAEGYLSHPILGRRLIECSEAVLAVGGKSADEILGDIDSMKLRSSMTLFELVSEPESVFASVLDKYYGGERDVRTLQILNRMTEAH